MSDRRWYVNAYEVGRAYGGPEEGGWFYERGTPLASVPVTTIEEAERERRRLEHLFGPEYEGRRHRTAVWGESNLEVYVQEHVAAEFPREQPHYE